MVTKCQIIAWCGGEPNHADPQTALQNDPIKDRKEKQLEAKPRDCQGLKEKLMVSENESSLHDETKHWCRPRTDD